MLVSEYVMRKSVLAARKSSFPKSCLTDAESVVMGLAET